MEIFSERERDVIKLRVKGVKGFTISEVLYISSDTVNSHVKNINKKLVKLGLLGFTQE